MAPTAFSSITRAVEKTAPTPQISHGAHPQNHSPLFSTLPGEIRQRIYTFVLSSFDDLSKPFNPQHHHYRPGYRYGQKYDLRLLQTCKRVWHEARLLPISLNEIVFYLYRGPSSTPPGYFQHDWRMRYRILNQDQQDAVHTVHFFARQCYLESTQKLLAPENGARSLAELRGLNAAEAGAMTAKMIVLTFRRSDWWAWESPVMSNDQIGICPWRRGRTDWKQMEAESFEGPEGDWNGWGGQFQYVRGLDTLKIEFETVATKKRQLDRVVGRAKHWKFPLEDDRVLAWTREMKESTWEGMAILKEESWGRKVLLRSLRGDPVDEKPTTCTYVVITMTWRAARREETD